MLVGRVRGCVDGGGCECVDSAWCEGEVGEARAIHNTPFHGHPRGGLNG